MHKPLDKTFAQVGFLEGDYMVLRSLSFRRPIRFPFLPFQVSFDKVSKGHTGLSTRTLIPSPPWTLPNGLHILWLLRIPLQALAFSVL